jgi:putative peptidoglycan lipid II flippase
VYLFTLRGFYAQQDTRTPFLVNAFENACTIGLALALFPAFGVRGLALAYSGAYVIAAIVALVLLMRRIGDLLPPEVLATAMRALVGAAALGLVAAITAGVIGRDSPARAAVAVAVGAVTGGLAYAGVLAAMRSDELRGVFRALRRRGTTDAGV